MLETANAYDTIIGEHKRLILLADRDVKDRIVLQ